MIDLITEIAGYIAGAAVLGLLLGYLIWGWGRRAALAAARAEGAAAARTSVDGSPPMRARLEAMTLERDTLQVELERLRSEAMATAAAAAADSARTARAAAPAMTLVHEVATAEPAPTPAGPPPASLLSAPPEEVDDLKRIKGIGPKMERVLNDKGIYLFGQLANFSPADIAWVSAAIEAFPGRIDRDRWVEQARVLHREKYGRTHDA